MANKLNNSTLASYWSPPDNLPEHVEAGEPLVCIATTFTFHADLVERDLLPRFLGLRFDDTEGERQFFVERDEKLAQVYAAVLVDTSQVDRKQSTLRWDQIPVAVPGGVQHSKVSILAWENCIRLIVASANLTKTGYRTNREVAMPLDFIDHPTSMPRALLTDALSFMDALQQRCTVAEEVKARLTGALAQVRKQLEGWGNIPDAFSPREYPRAHFVPVLHAEKGGAVFVRLRELWGARKASTVGVVTPFVGNPDANHEELLAQLKLTFNSTRNTTPWLGTGNLYDGNEMGKGRLGIPDAFRRAFKSVWGLENDWGVYAAPLLRAGESRRRPFHAKAISAWDDTTELLLVGSSNFSHHGLGFGQANIEANLAILHQDKMELAARVPVADDDWLDEQNVEWPAEQETLNDEPVVEGHSPFVVWALYAQTSGTLTLGLASDRTRPSSWRLTLDDSRFVLLSSQDHVPDVPEFQYGLPEQLRGVDITALVYRWKDTDQPEQSVTIPVQTRSPADLLPPGEVRNLSVNAIVEALLRGRSVADIIDEGEKDPPDGGGDKGGRVVPAIDTSGFLLYRMRRLGVALGKLGERLLRTRPYEPALRYALLQDPFGPCKLADALIRESDFSRPGDREAVLFALGELRLIVGHAFKRIATKDTKHSIQQVFLEAITALVDLSLKTTAPGGIPKTIEDYLGAIRKATDELIAV